MLIRVDGRHDGVKAYLEHGRKKDREFTRDELDERIVLAGDLELADAISRSVDVSPDVDRYLSITLSFREDEIQRETLQSIAREFEEFVFSAYRRDEYCFYAEAHLPRIKSYVDRRTGQLVERKPHIHVVLPKVNLVSGAHMEPLGFVKSNLDYIDAFQEHINAKYGLASPKDHRRVQITDASEMVSRYRGDLFGQARRDFKESLLDAVLDRRIERYEEFLALLAAHGDVRIRNAGRADAYPNVKPDGEAKGINLKEYVFSREFIELPTDEKEARLGADVTPQYEVVGAKRPVQDETLARLDDWRAWRAREVKYISSGAALEKHRQAAPADQRLALDALERGFYSQHLRKHHESEPGQWREGQHGSGGTGRQSDVFGYTGPERVLRRAGRIYPFRFDGAATDRGRGRDRRDGGNGWRGARRVDVGHRWVHTADPWRRQPGVAADQPLSQAGSVNGLRNLSGVPVVRVGGARPMLLPDHAFDRLEHRRTERADSLRRRGDREPAGLVGIGRQADTEIERLLAEAHERGEQARSAERIEFAVIRKQLDANRLLAELTHTHGVVPEKYRAFRGRDGAWRVRAGTRNLNVSDFLTKELNLPWRDASRILRDVYAQQRAGEPVRAARQRPESRLWREYCGVRESASSQRRVDWDAQRRGERERRKAVREDFRAEKARISADPRLDRAGRRAAMSVARMERVAREVELAAAIHAERSALRDRAAGTSYESFLLACAQAGDVEALSEFRRSAARRSRLPATEPENLIRPIDAGGERNEMLLMLPALTWSVDSRGDVVYRRDDLDVLRDESRAVQVLTLDRAAIEAGLRLAQGKFGRTLQLDGSDAYRLSAARVAADAGIDVTFSDPALNAVMNARRQEVVDARLAGVNHPRADALRAARPSDTPLSSDTAAVRKGPSL